MARPRRHFGFEIIVGFCVASFVVVLFLFCQGLQENNLNVKRSEFPQDFLFGAATSAQQIEGSGNTSGRGQSIWDHYNLTPGNILDGNNSLTSIDSYKRFKEDIRLLKATGVDTYRFSISWPRILPCGSLRAGVNKEGINFYNKVINELIKHKIKPFVTMLHFDTPQALDAAYGGFLNRSIVNDFRDYAELLFKTYGDRVKYWVTVNEPFVAALGYDLGKFAPGRCSLPPPFGPCPAGNSATEPYIIGHNYLLAHATAVRLYRQRFQAQQGGKIGMVVVGEYMEPYTNLPEDIAAAERYPDFLYGWHVEPLIFGDYPKSMREYVKSRLPTLTEDEKDLVKGAYDFIGVNYFTSRFAFKTGPSVPPHYLGDSLVKITPTRNDAVIGLKAEGGGYVYSYPIGLLKLLMFMKRKYNNPPIIITANGYAEANVANRSIDEALNDQDKIKYMREHLYYLKEAIKKGVNVKGYFYWSLFDCYEWGSGFTLRFGLYYIDYSDNLRRIPKMSAKWFSNFLRGGNFTSLF